MSADSADSHINLVINQRASFEVLINVKDQTKTNVDLTNYTIAAKYTSDYDGGDQLSVPINAQISNAVGGEIKLDLSSSETAVMSHNIRYSYDVVITNTTNDFRTRIIEGTIKVNPGVA